MTEGQIQGKRVFVRINGEFEITEFELARFNCTLLSDWFKNLLPLSHPIRTKTKANRDSPVHVFLRFAPATLFASSFGWFTGLSVSFVIGQSDNLGFGFTAHN